MPLTPLSKTPDLYSDFIRTFEINPITDDLALLKNERAVKEAIRNLLLTNRGERFYQPELGCDIRKLLFENLTPQTIIVAKEMISKTINTYEPRANLIGVDVQGEADSNKINITVVFNVLNKERPVELNVILTRVR